MPFSIRDTFTSCEPKRERRHRLLQGVDAPCQHVQVVQRRDRGGQVAFGVIQLLNITGDFFNLNIENHRRKRRKVKNDVHPSASSSTGK